MKCDNCERPATRFFVNDTTLRSSCEGCSVIFRLNRYHWTPITKEDYTLLKIEEALE